MSTARFDAGATVRNFGCMMYWNQAALISATGTWPKISS